jgi:putative endonuclease
VGKIANRRGPLDRQRLGSAAEERAAQLLQLAGYDIVVRTFRCRMGELDIVARRGSLLVIAEVRLRRSGRFGGPGASISPAKRARIVRAARFLLATRPCLAALAVRFDALLLHSGAGPIDWIEGAFYRSLRVISVWQQSPDGHFETLSPLVCQLRSTRSECSRCYGRCSDQC